MKMMLKTLDTILYTDIQNIYLEKKEALKTIHIQLGKKRMKHIHNNIIGPLRHHELNIEYQNQNWTQAILFTFFYFSDMVFPALYPPCPKASRPGAV